MHILGTLPGDTNERKFTVPAETGKVDSLFYHILPPWRMRFITMSRNALIIAFAFFPPRLDCGQRLTTS